MRSLAVIHVGKKQLGLDDGAYRAMLERVTGKLSAKDMSEVERSRVVAEMRRCGFKPLSKGFQKGFPSGSKTSQTGFKSNSNGSNGYGKSQEAVGAQSPTGKQEKLARSDEVTTGKTGKARSRLYRKLQALWIAGYNLGLVRDRRDKALDTFIREKCNGLEVQAVEALKGWLAREAGIYWQSPHHRSDKERVAAAQWLILCHLSSLSARCASTPLENADYHPGGYMAAVRGIVGKPYGALRDGDWHEVMNVLGERLRGLQQAVEPQMRGGRQDG